MTYSKKLENPLWQKKRLLILQRDDFKCTLCSDNKTLLHIHHKKYVGGNPWDTPDEYLITYCKVCHQIAEFLKKEKMADFILVKTIKYFKTDDEDDYPSQIVSIIQLPDEEKYCYLFFRLSSDKSLIYETSVRPNILKDLFEENTKLREKKSNG